MTESLQQKASYTERPPSEKEVADHPAKADKTFKRLQIKDSISWSICFAVIAAITGALLIYQVGITISSVTSGMFYFSLAGLGFFIARAILLYSSYAHKAPESAGSPELN